MWQQRVRLPLRYIIAQAIFSFLVKTESQKSANKKSKQRKKSITFLSPIRRGGLPLGKLFVKTFNAIVVAVVVAVAVADVDVKDVAGNYL